MFVKDNGLGIASEDLPNIFQRFYKGSKSSISSTKSRGLGLSITKEIVEYHGGHSKINKGSTFYFSLPIY
ncbi:ATP-binding protein [Maledivibacter halophilus]|uniref:ATP-binding protein n=1 Tax=Maledivibacter halophilus TaxID=36842 RepID=UPI0038B7A8FA